MYCKKKVLGEDLCLRAIRRDAACSRADDYHYSRGLDGLVWEAYRMIYSAILIANKTGH